MTITRAPHFAGRDYFADAGRLRASVESFIEDSSPPRINGEICALIAPHGRHPECGAIAGFAYKLLLTTPLTWDVVTLLAPDSSEAHELLCDPSEAYDTPLEPIRIDRATVNVLHSAGVPIVQQPDDGAIIESHLPFIQVALGDAPVLPLRVPIGFDPTRLNRNVNQLGLIVAAANLPLAQEQMACDAIVRLNAHSFMGEAIVEKSKGLSSLFGAKQIKFAPSADATVLALTIQLAKAKGANDARLLKREESRAAFALCRVRNT